MEATQDNPPTTSLAPVFFPATEILWEIARIWAVRYIYDQEDNCETVYGIAWKRLRASRNCWVPERGLAPNSPAELQKKYDLDVACRKILFQKQTSAGKVYWIHWEGNGEPWCEWWGEEKVSIFAPDLASQMDLAPDFGVGKEASWDAEMDVDEMGLETVNNRCPTSIICWVKSILPGEGDANVPNDATA